MTNGDRDQNDAPVSYGSRSDKMIVGLSKAAAKLAFTGGLAVGLINPVVDNFNERTPAVRIPMGISGALLCVTIFMVVIGGLAYRGNHNYGMTAENPNDGAEQMAAPVRKRYRMDTWARYVLAAAAVSLMVGIVLMTFGT
jgi:hypothetical protein